MHKATRRTRAVRDRALVFRAHDSIDAWSHDLVYRTKSKNVTDTKLSATSGDLAAYIHVIACPERARNNRSRENQPKTARRAKRKKSAITLHSDTPAGENTERHSLKLSEAGDGAGLR